MGSEGSINLGHEAGVEDLSGQVHKLPCSIDCNGPCSVSQYFKPKLAGFETEGLRMEEAYFRGRKLHGATIPLPDGYSGCVLRKKNVGKRELCDSSQDSNHCWEVKAKFYNMTYWNHDSLPSQDDAFLRSFHLLTLAKTLHKPVTDEDLASASSSLKD